MKKGKRNAWLLVALVLSCLQMHAQTNSNATLIHYQDTLKNLSNSIINSEISTQRVTANYRFIKTLVRALKVKNSFEFRFDSVENMRILYAPDNSFRIMTWYVATGNASYRFYGAIQMNQSPLTLFALVDHSEALKKPKTSRFNYKNWYGAYYYQLIPATYQGQTYYTLLGWKGKDNKTTQRLIETLYFKNGEPYFGLAVLGAEKQTRMIFEYSDKVTMMLKYLPKSKTILFDHLAPSSSENKDKFEFYGPDLTYDALRLGKNGWKSIENIDLRNEKSNLDEFFINPADPEK